ncbi:fatty-acid-binding protein 3, chloroplastic [Typha angustifolia]|uniref:fatty-acid-binding protein 3, chloroplastic n=1 Tax=Typha angustifolia TaxID=59011 RepID=UPI003C2C199B
MTGAVSVPTTPLFPTPRCRPNSSFLLQSRPLSLNLPRLRSAFHSLGQKSLISLAPRASVGNVEYAMEPATNVKFPKELSVPGSSKQLILLGTGFREKIFAIIGVKVYAAGFYVEGLIRDSLDAVKGKSSSDILEDSSVFYTIYETPVEKSLRIILVRDVDGKTFWNALDDVITPRIEKPTAMDESAISIFRNTFQGRDLKQGTCIFLTWTEPSKMLISVSPNEFPMKVDAEIESKNVNLALYDGFFGNSPVSPSLKASIADALPKILS